MAWSGESGTPASGAGGYRLHGRNREIGVVTGLVSQLAEGAGGALVVRGEPGIGKSALLMVVRAQARDHGLRVLSTVGVQSEARLAFAGLHQLLRPVLSGVGRLPARQQAALLGAFGMSEDAAGGVFLAGLATLELISDATEASPVVVIADDAHWLDEPSCSVLAFVARRLGPERALMVIAVRDGFTGPFDEAELPELRLSQPAQLRGGGRVAGHGMAEGSRRQECTEPRLVLSLAHGAHQGSCADEARSLRPVARGPSRSRPVVAESSACGTVQDAAVGHRDAGCSACYGSQPQPPWSPR